MGSGPPWSRESRSEAESVEVPLIGDDESSPRLDSVQSTDRRWFVLAGVAVLTAVITVAVVSSLGSSDATPASNTTTTDAVPIEEIPPPEFDDLDDPTGEQPVAMPEFSGVVVPTFPSIDEASGESGEAGADLGRAVGLAGDGAALRSTTRVVLGFDGWAREYTMLRDRVNDRYEVTGSADGEPTDHFIVDMATETTYYSIGGDDWASASNRPDADQVGVADIRVVLDRLMLGPLRADTFDRAEIEPTGRVAIDDVGANAFTVALPGAAIPEWQLYFFGPVEEFDPADRPSTLVYDVYVSDDGAVFTVVGVADIGGVAQLVEHQFEVLAEPIEIELPQPDPGR